MNFNTICEFFVFVGTICDDEKKIKSDVQQLLFFYVCVCGNTAQIKLDSYTKQ